MDQNTKATIVALLVMVMVMAIFIGCESELHVDIAVPDAPLSVAPVRANSVSFGVSSEALRL